MGPPPPRLDVVTLRSPRLRSRDTSANEVALAVQRAAGEAGWECQVRSMVELDAPGLQVDDYKSLLEANPKTGFPELDAQARPLTLPSLSNLVRHRDVIRRVAEAAEALEAPNLTLVLEDDALRTDATPALVTRFLQAAARNAFKADIVFAGLPRVTPDGKVQPDSLTLKDADLNDIELLRLQSAFLVLPSKESYFLTPAGAKKLWAHWKDKVSFRTAVQLSWSIRALNLKAFYFSTNLFVDGSKVGYYAISCAAHGALLYNAAYMGALAALQKPDRGAADLEAAQQALEGLEKVMRNPNVTHQRGVVAFLRGDHKRAHALLLEAYDLAIAEGACIDHTSDLLNNAINVCRFAQ